MRAFCGTLSLPLAEIVADQRADRLDRLILVGTVDLERDLRSLAGGEHHHAHDALRVDLAAVARDLHVALKFGCELRQLGRSARMQAQLVDDLNFALVHRRKPSRTATRPRSRRTPLS